ncbi:uncharacterized protein LOC133737080 [Rosa rugosa]|uniref:uncharacterized protein LOC133737080 n=1 Tax=Rosa rugosa TaxID=74645 RepID=UPI002B402BEA|nr:uncharacterized protein LOC133737080 [Rosa rugosa]
MRQSNATKQSKLMRFISSPIRSLTKAKNFYMKSLEDCAAKVGYGGGGAGVGGYTASQVPQLPRSFSGNSSSSNDDEDLRQLLRTASSKKNNDAEKRDNKVAGSEMHRRGRPNVSIRQPTMNNAMGMRSYSVGLKMGRIDEERASTFEEDEVDVKADFYTRNRSYGVNKRNAGIV